MIRHETCQEQCSLIKSGVECEDDYCERTRMIEEIYRPSVTLDRKDRND